MAVVSITVEPPTDLQSLVRAAFQIGSPPTEFRALIEGGWPVFEAELYGDREFHEVADELDAVVSMLRRTGVEYVIREGGFEITTEELTGLLAEGRERFRPPVPHI